MISEDAQERAALHSLGLLDAGQAAAFEQELAASAELRALAAELAETAAALALAVPGVPPVGLKARVLARITAERREGGDENGFAGRAAGPAWSAWVPWALAASLALCCGALAVRGYHWRQEFLALERKTSGLASAPDEKKLWQEVAVCRLERTTEAVPQPRATVLWDAAQHRGRLSAEHLPPLEAGKDYQLWVVNAGEKTTVNAGVVAVDKDGHAETVFQPLTGGGNGTAVAFALSVERAGGSPVNEGPILFLGKL